MRIFPSLGLAFSLFCMPLTAMPVDVREYLQALQEELNNRPVVELFHVVTGAGLENWINDSSEDNVLAIPEGVSILLKAENENALFEFDAKLEIKTKARVLLARNGFKWMVRSAAGWVRLEGALEKVLLSSLEKNEPFKTYLHLTHEGFELENEFDNQRNFLEEEDVQGAEEGVTKE